MADMAGPEAVNPGEPYIVGDSHGQPVMVRETPWGRQIAVWRILHGSDDVVADWDMPTVGLHDRVERVEARQRAYGVHDPDCPVFQTAQAQRRTGAHLFPPDCTCWLSAATVTETEHWARPNDWDDPPFGSGGRP